MKTEYYPNRNLLYSWAVTIPASIVAFFGSFFLGIFMPWMVVTGGVLGLDMISRRGVAKLLQVDIYLHPMELAYHPFQFSAKRAASYFLRFFPLWFFGPLILLTSLLGGSGVMLYDTPKYHTGGVILLSAFPGLLFTSLWWGTWWMFLAPVLLLGAGIVEAGLVVSRYMQLWGLGIFSTKSKERTRGLYQKTKGVYREVAQTGERVAAGAAGVARDVKESAVSGARGVRETAISGARGVRETAAAGARGVSQKAGEIPIGEWEKPYQYEREPGLPFGTAEYSNQPFAQETKFDIRDTGAGVGLGHAHVHEPAPALSDLGKPIDVGSIPVNVSKRVS